MLGCYSISRRHALIDNGLLAALGTKLLRAAAKRSSHAERLRQHGTYAEH